MKRKSWTSCLTGALMAWVLSACAAGCVVTGFSFDTVSMAQVIFACGVLSALCAVCFRFKRGPLVLLCAAALITGFLWREGSAWEQIKVALYRISIRYDNAYGWGRLDLGIVDRGVPLDLAFMVLGAPVAADVSWVVTRRKNVLFAVPAVVLPLFACLVVTDTVPSEGFLYGLLLGLMVLLLTDWVRRKGRGRDGAFTALAAMAVAAGLAALFLAVPQEGYVNHAAEWGDRLTAWGEELLGLAEETAGEISTGGNVDSGERVNLRAIGPRVLRNTTVMHVTSTGGGTVYLRGQDYNTYSGTGWIASENRSETFAQGEGGSETLTIRTNGIRPVRYVPYGVAEAVTLTGGRVKNDELLQEYSYSVSKTLVQARSMADSQYSQLPAETLRWARELAGQIAGEEQDTSEKARAIAEFVRNSAAYDLNTGRMESEYTDFAQWFLEESETGYCVHFATAATVLLRAAGIPARYVEGYMVTCAAGAETAVTGKMAHAWAEYEDSGVWRVLEATPAAEAIAAPETEPEATGQATESEETADMPTLPHRQEEKETQTRPGVSTEAPAQTPRAELPAWVGALLWWLTGLALGLGVVWGQSALRLYLARVRWCRGRPNQRAIARWAQLERSARLVKVPVPGELEVLAQKARYSQHTLTREELQQFEEFRAELSRQIRRMGWGRRLLLRIVFAVK